MEHCCVVAEPQELLVYVISHVTAFLLLADFKYLIYSQSNFAQQTAGGEGGGDRKVWFQFLDISS